MENDLRGPSHSSYHVRKTDGEGPRWLPRALTRLWKSTVTTASGIGTGAGIGDDVLAPSILKVLLQAPNAGADHPDADVVNDAMVSPKVCFTDTNLDAAVIEVAFDPPDADPLAAIAASVLDVVLVRMWRQCQSYQSHSESRGVVGVHPTVGNRPKQIKSVVSKNAQSNAGINSLPSSQKNLVGSQQISTFVLKGEGAFVLLKLLWLVVNLRVHVCKLPECTTCASRSRFDASCVPRVGQSQTTSPMISRAKVPPSSDRRRRNAARRQRRVAGAAQRCRSFSAQLRVQVESLDRRGRRHDAAAHGTRQRLPEPPANALRVKDVLTRE
jgi:hypothetical protein